MKKWPAYLIATSSCFLFVLCYTHSGLVAKVVSCKGRSPEPRSNHWPTFNLLPDHDILLYHHHHQHQYRQDFQHGICILVLFIIDHCADFVCWHQCHFNSYPRLSSALNLERACWSVSPEIKNIARGTTDPGYQVYDLNHFLPEIWLKSFSWKGLLKFWTQYPGSVVPLAMFFASICIIW